MGHRLHTGKQDSKTMQVTPALSLLELAFSIHKDLSRDQG